MENWKPIVGYEGIYSVSDKGNVRSDKRTVYKPDRSGNIKPFNYKEKQLKLYKKIYKKKGCSPRYEISLCKDGKRKGKFVHRLVAEAFIPNPKNLETVNHKDGNPLNNNVDNLEWLSNADNIRHAFNSGLMTFLKPVIKLHPNTLEELEEYPSETAACRAHGMRDDKIRRAIQRNGTSAGYKWKYKDVSMKEGD